MAKFFSRLRRILEMVRYIYIFFAYGEFEKRRGGGVRLRQNKKAATTFFESRVGLLATSLAAAVAQSGYFDPKVTPAQEGHKLINAQVRTCMRRLGCFPGHGALSAFASRRFAPKILEHLLLMHVAFRSILPTERALY